jgi:hypothetical protein
MTLHNSEDSFYDVACGCMLQVEEFLLVLRPVIKEN